MPKIEAGFPYFLTRNAVFPKVKKMLNALNLILSASEIMFVYIFFSFSYRNNCFHCYRDLEDKYTCRIPQCLCIQHRPLCMDHYYIHLCLKWIERTSLLLSGSLARRFRKSKLYRIAV